MTLSRLAISPKSLFLLVVLTLGWGINWPIMKLVVAEMPVFTFRAWCCVAGAVGIYAIARFRGEHIRPTRRDLAILGLSGFFNIFLWNILAVSAVAYLPSGRAAIIGFTMPLWAAAISLVFLGEKATPRRLIGLVLGAVALALLMGDEVAKLGDAPIGIAMMLAAAIGWAIGTAILKQRKSAMGESAAAFWQFVLGGIPMIAGYLWLEPFWPENAGFAGWAGFIYNLTVVSVLCYWIWNTLVQTTPIAVSSMSTLMIPVVGVVSGALWLGEPVGWNELGALVAVVTALATVILPAKPKPAGSP
ncbi:MAG: DMT family transporter [Alphaproteobacteria bacterium]|nr:DMT family transporter [Alphaproteobacteria bacterium]